MYAGILFGSQRAQALWRGGGEGRVEKDQGDLNLYEAKTSMKQYNPHQMEIYRGRSRGPLRTDILGKNNYEDLQSSLESKQL